MLMKTFWWTQIIVEMACRKDNEIIVSDFFNGKLKLNSSFLLNYCLLSIWNDVVIDVLNDIASRCVLKKVGAYFRSNCIGVRPMWKYRAWHHGNVDS